MNWVSLHQIAFATLHNEAKNLGKDLIFLFFLIMFSVKLRHSETMKVPKSLASPKVVGKLPQLHFWTPFTKLGPIPILS